MAAFRRDVLGLLLESAATYGDIVRFRVGPIVVHFVNEPASIAQVLQSKGRYDKQTRSTAAIRAICDASLLTTEGPAWERRRRLMQPAFHRQRLGTLVDRITPLIDVRLATWRAGQTVDIASEMMRVTFAIVGVAILGVDVGAASADVEADIAFMLQRVFDRWGQIVPLPTWVPTRGQRRFRRALANVDAVVDRIIAEHRSGTSRAADLLTLLMDARDAESGAAFTDGELRNEVITMLLAGHETTASALAWTFAHLAAHPEAAARVRAEVAQVLGERTPTFDDLPALEVTTAAIQEAMRLSPPIWAIERRAVKADVIGGYAIPAGSSVIVSPYALHRHPRYWTSPLTFDLNRFVGVKAPAAYLPFGAGPRYCIGAEFAMLEARLVVAMVMQRWQLTLEPGHTVVPQPSLTLRLTDGLPMVPSPAHVVTTS